MQTLSSTMPRLSRAKALIGTMAATLVLTGAVQAAAPVSAPAMPIDEAKFCWDTYNSLVKAKDAGDEKLAEHYSDILEVFRCEGYINGL